MNSRTERQKVCFDWSVLEPREGASVAHHRMNLEVQGAGTRTSMATNGTDSPALHPACSLTGTFAWREEYLTPPNFVILIVVVCTEAAMIPFTVLFNALVIFLVWRKRYLRKQNPCVLQACLAATDLLVGVVVLPSVLAGHVLRLSGAPVCLVDAATLAIVFVLCGASVYHLVIISGERYVAIKYSLRYETLVTNHRLVTAVATASAVSLAPTLSALTNDTAVARTIYAIIFLGIPSSLAAICFCQVVVFLETRRHRQHILAHQVSQAAAKEVLKKDKAARTTTMIIGALLLCYAPIILWPVVTTAGTPTHAVVGGLFVSDLFTFGNSLVNPIIYCMRTQGFQRALRELFGLGDPQVDAPQAAGKPSRAVRRRICEAPPSFLRRNTENRLAWASACA